MKVTARTDMASRALVEKIEALPPAKRAEVEDFVEFLADRPGGPGMPSQELLDRIDARREALLREHGLFDTLPLIRALRDNGD